MYRNIRWVLVVPLVWVLHLSFGLSLVFSEIISSLVLLVRVSASLSVWLRCTIEAPRGRPLV
jgi:hypothetical protein